MKKLVVTLTVAVAVISGTSAFAKESQHGSFTFVENKDDFNDEHRSRIVTPSETSNRGAELRWECMSDGLNVIYVHGKYFAGDSDNDILVRYRMDGGDASEQQYWRLLQGQEGSWTRMSRVSTFTDKAKRGAEARFEAVDPMDGERLTDAFSLNGLSDALDKLPCYR